MQVVLNQDVPKLGYKGDVVSVKPGYFRNFLFPQGLAEFATKAKLKLTESRKEKMLIEKQKLLENAKEVLDKLKGLTLVFTAKASEKGKLYGAITEKDIIDEVQKQANIKLEKEFVKMEHLKEVGEYDVLVHLGEGMEEALKVKVDAAE